MKMTDQFKRILSSDTWTTVLPLQYDAFGKHKKKAHDQDVVLHQHDIWRKFVVLLREYKNISNISFKIDTTF
jgi:hypothetical protein